MMPTCLYETAFPITAAYQDPPISRGHRFSIHRIRSSLQWVINKDMVSRLVRISTWQIETIDDRHVVGEQVDGIQHGFFEDLSDIAKTKTERCSKSIGSTEYSTIPIQRGSAVT